VLFLDRSKVHRAQASRQLARSLGIELRWLPTACPELNPVDHLWRHLKRDVLANEPIPDLEATLQRAWAYLQDLSPRDRLRKAGILSGNFWLADVFPANV
jgi:transposase